MLMLTVINFSRLNLNVFDLMRGVNGCLLTTCKSRVFVGEYCIANLVVLCNAHERERWLYTLTC